MKALWRFFIAISLFPACNYSSTTRLPDFRISLADGRQIPVSERIGDKNVMLIHFDSDCSGCQDEARTVIRHIEKLQDVHIIFLSVQDSASINYFGYYFKFHDYPNITIGRDIDTAMARHFHSPVTPLTALYDRNHNLRAVFEGGVDTNKFWITLNEIKP